MRWLKPDIDKLKKKKKINELLNAMGYPKDSSIREDAIYALRELKIKGIVEPLCKALEDKVDGVRIAAVRTLSDLKDDKAVDSLVKLVNDPFCGLDVIFALGNIGSKKALSHLRNCIFINDNPLGIERKCAIEALMKIGDENIADILVAGIKDKSSIVRETSANAIKKIGVPKDIKTQIWLAIADNDWERIISQREIAVKALSDALYLVENNEVKKNIIKILGKIRNEQALLVLLEAFKKEKSLVNNILKELCQFKDKKIINPILTALDNHINYNNDVLINAINCLSEMGDENTTTLLCKVLKHSDGKVRLSAIQALSKIGDEKALNSLKYLSEHDTYQEEEIDTFDMTSKYSGYLVRKAALDAIEKIKQQR